MPEESPGCGRPYPFYVIESRVELTLAAAVAVVSDAESVSFITQGLHHAQTLALLVDVERYAVARKVDFLQALRYAHKGYLVAQAHLIESLYGGIELPLASIHHYQLWKLFAFGHEARVATVQHFLHGGEVIGTYHGLYVEMAIVAARGLAIAEHHAGGHGIRALYIGIVEALYVSGFLAETEVALHALHEAGHGSVRITLVGLFLLVEPVSGHILLPHAQELLAIAARGDCEGDTLKGNIWCERHYYLPEAALKAALYLAYGH